MDIILPAPELIARFRGDLSALTGDAPGRLGVAVSGGADSLALLLLSRAAFPGAVAAATVDHRLRPESTDEAAFVADTCASLGMPHDTLEADVAIQGNVQASARNLRYRLLAGWAAARDIEWLLTAHHADDQAETLLMRLQRGAGIAGLAGIRATGRIAGQKVARPLLGWRRNTLEAVVAEVGIAAIRDPSNEDARYDRARLRIALAGVDGFDALPVAHSAAALAEAEAALEWTAAELYGERVRADGGAVSFDPAELPAELRRRIVLDILSLLAPESAPRGAEVQRLIAALDAGETATLAGIRCSGGAPWRFAAAPPRR